jgi:hypothetical protein
MTLHDEIRNSEAGRSLALGRTVGETFRHLGWTTREGAAYTSGLADVAATQAWERKNGETRVHLVVRCELAERVLFSEMSRVTEDVIASHAAGDILDLARPSPPPPAAPPARVHAAAFRAGEPFRTVLEESFTSIEDVLRELRAHDLDLVCDDVAAGAEESAAMASVSRRRDLVHALVVTDAVLWTVGERLARHPWLRLHRARVIGADDRWVDIINTDAVEKYAASVTRYYASPKRR